MEGLFGAYYDSIDTPTRDLIPSTIGFCGRFLAPSPPEFPESFTSSLSGF